MITTATVTNDGHHFELVNLLNPTMNKPYGTAPIEERGEFALASFTTDAEGRTVFRGGRTIGVPARVVCQLVTPTHTRFIVSHTIREIRDVWMCDLPANSFMKPFDPTYTEMLPAFFWVTIKPWLMRDRRYQWFLPGPPYASYPQDQCLPADVATIGTRYIEQLMDVLHDQILLIPDDEPIGVALSGGADSAAVATVLLEVLRRSGRMQTVYCVTLAVDSGGTDLAHAQAIVRELASHFSDGQIHIHVIPVSSSVIDCAALMERAAVMLEEYHIRDVECGMAGILLHEGIAREVSAGKLPPIRFVFDGDGGNEIFRDYPLADEGYGLIRLDDVWENPHLFYLGYERTKLAFNPVFSSGLSRAYTRTFNPARAFGVTGFSPLIDRRLIDFGQRIPLRTLAPHPDALHSLRGEVVRTGIKAVLGINLPIFPKARFQEGCSADPKLLRVTMEDSLRLKHLVLGA